MYELLLRTETLFRGLPATVLLAVGAGGILIGMVLWLGGTRYSAAIIGLLGAVVGCAAGLLAGQWLDANPWLAMLIGAIVLGGLSVLLRNVLILVLAVLVVSAVSGAGYLSVILDRAVPPPAPEAQAPAGTPGAPARSFQYFSSMAPAERMSYMDGLSQGKEETFGERLKALLTNTWEAARPHRWAMVLALIAGAAVGILLVWLIAKIVIALAYSLVGTALIFLGIQAALLAAGVLAVSDLGSRPRLPPIAFGTMTIVGWLWQLLHTGARRPKAEPAQKAERSD